MHTSPCWQCPSEKQVTPKPPVCAHTVGSLVCLHSRPGAHPANSARSHSSPSLDASVTHAILPSGKTVRQTWPAGQFQDPEHSAPVELWPHSPTGSAPDWATQKSSLAQLPHVHQSPSSPLAHAPSDLPGVLVKSHRKPSGHSKSSVHRTVIDAVKQEQSSPKHRQDRSAAQSAWLSHATP